MITIKTFPICNKIIRLASVIPPAWRSIHLNSARAIFEDVSDAPALVAGLGPGVGAVLEDVPDLVAVVAHGLITVLGAVPADVPGAVTSVAPVPPVVPLLTAAPLGKVAPALALVALEAPAPAILPVPGVLHLPPLLDHEVPGSPRLPPHVPSQGELEGGRNWLWHTKEVPDS